MAKFNVEEFMSQVSKYKAQAELNKTASAAPTEAAAEARGAANAAAKAAEVQAAAADELSTADAKLGPNVGDEKIKMERRLERLAGQQVQAQAAAEMAAETLVAAPTNAPTMLAKTAEGEDRVAHLLGRINDLLSKEASNFDEEYEIQKTAEEAVQYGRLMAIGFVDGLNEILSSSQEEGQ